MGTTGRVIDETALSGDQWRPVAASHQQRVDAALADVVHRRDRGIKHPIDDFLFEYYNLRPSQLRTWHPGIGIRVQGAEHLEDHPFYRTVDGWSRLDHRALLAKRERTVETAHRLLSATTEAEPRFGCFGMHEWAMVHGLQPDQTRHPQLPLRFTPERIAAIVEEVGCRCSHFDAFRFFTDGAKPLNAIQPRRDLQVELDQPGCLHVNMDLYRWAGKLHPAVGSELLFETFLLAREIRVVDMRASAYDLRDLGHDPITVETPRGRAEYADHQRRFATRARPLRAALLRVSGELLDAHGQRPGGPRGPSAH